MRMNINVEVEFLRNGNVNVYDLDRPPNCRLWLSNISPEGAEQSIAGWISAQARILLEENSK